MLNIFMNCLRGISECLFCIIILFIEIKRFSFIVNSFIFVRTLYLVNDNQWCLLYQYFLVPQMLYSYSNYVDGPFLCNKSGCDFCSIEYHPQFHRMAVLHIFVHILNRKLDPHFCQRQIQPDNTEEDKGLKRQEVDFSFYR